ncbi:MAG: hypothetical protein ILA02_00700 [Clostridia bacterium]|nr:hypothetical protein [Clostridia bacterium]
MKIEKFKIIQFIRELIIIIDKEMDNYPKKDIELKSRIRANTFDILELACTKLLVPRNGTNVEETVNIENKLNLVYNIFM